MKKFLATFTVVAILCGSIIGCGDDKKAAPVKDKDAKPVKDKDAKPAS